MKNDIFLTLEKSDFSILEDTEVLEKDSTLSIILKPYFDTDRKFGLDTNSSDMYVELQLLFHPFDEKVRIEYGIFGGEKDYIREYIPTDEENTMFIALIEEACKENHDLSCREYYINTYMSLLVEDFELVFEKEKDYFQIRNLVDDFVLFKSSDESMAKYVGKEIEPVYIESGKCYGFKCDETDELIYRADEVDAETEDEEIEM